MEQQDNKAEIIKETYSSEILSIILDLIAGTLLTILILPFESFILLILIIPGLLSVRGNTGGAFAARTNRDIIIGNFNMRTWFENISAAFILSLVSGLILGFLSVILNIFIFKNPLINNLSIFFIPILTLTFDQFISLPTSTLFSYFVFKIGLNPNNIVSPIMTGIDDILVVVFFYFSIIFFGVP